VPPPTSVLVDPDELTAIAREIAALRANLLEGRTAFVSPGGAYLGVEAVDRPVDDVLHRSQRGLVEVAADLDFVARSLDTAAATWRQTEHAVAGGCR
jgi:hypothetical protein